MYDPSDDLLTFSDASLLPSQHPTTHMFEKPDTLKAQAQIQPPSPVHMMPMMYTPTPGTHEGEISLTCTFAPTAERSFLCTSAPRAAGHCHSISGAKTAIRSTPESENPNEVRHSARRRRPSVSMFPDATAIRSGMLSRSHMPSLHIPSPSRLLAHEPESEHGRSRRHRLCPYRRCFTHGGCNSHATFAGTTVNSSPLSGGRLRRRVCSRGRFVGW